MSFQGTENIPIQVNLLIQADYTGWTLPGDGTAVHSSCQAGYITLLNYSAIAGRTYKVTYTALTLSEGYLCAFVGGTSGPHYTTPAIIVDTITAGSNGTLQLYSTANCTVQLFNIQDITINDPVNIVWSEENKKWSDTRSYNPSFGFSLIDTNGLMYHGNLYIQQNGSSNRNNFFGTQYQSSIKFVDAKNPSVINGFESLNYQANMLLVTPINGIQTSIGQLSTLIDTDFIKEKLASAGLEVINYQKDNVYSASFLSDSNEDTVNGSPLRGNYVIIELVTVDGSIPLQLFTVDVKTTRIPTGAR